MEKKDTKKGVNNLLKSERGRAILFFLFYFVFFLVIILMARTNLSNNKKNNTNTSSQSTTSIKAETPIVKISFIFSLFIFHFSFFSILSKKHRARL